VLVAITAFWGLMSGKQAVSIQGPEIILSSDKIPQGELSLISVIVENSEVPEVRWLGKKVYLVPDRARRTWNGFLGVDLRSSPGIYPVLVRVSPTHVEKRIRIEVDKKNYGVRRLTLPRKMVELDAVTLRRVKKEGQVMKEVFQAPVSRALWRGPFQRPVDGEVVGPFGRSSIINGHPRAPHSGVDFRAARGTPVKAINNGRVVLTCNHFFTGKSVVLDHGGGIISMYFHLEKILVQKGQILTKGEVLGLVGSTGRATGPHLHLGVRVNGARVDPLTLVSLSRELER